MGDIMKNKIDYKLVNFLLILLIFFIMYETRNIWIAMLSIVTEVLKPIIISLIISYIFNLYLKKLNKFFNKYISVTIFLTTITLLIFTIYKLFGQILEQIKNSSSIIIYFIKEVLIKYNLDIFDLYNKIGDITEYLPKTFNNILNYITLFIVIISSSIYMFIDFNKIKKIIKLLPEKIYNYIITINKDIESYTYSFIILSIISVIEYTITFKIIGHPNYLFLGLLSGILSLIPMFGGILTNAFAIITSFIINYKLFIRTLIGILILTILDGYVISPIIYSKNNKMHPIIVIISIYIGGKIFGITGIIFALPTLVIIISTYKYLKNL